MKNIKILLILVLVLNIYSLTIAQNIVENIGLEQGRYSVGFDLREYKDFSRTSIQSGEYSAKTKARSVRMYMWYPAKENSGETNTIKDFFLKQVEDFGEVNDSSKLEELVYFSTQFNRIPKSKIDEILKKEALSVNKADNVEGKFPVVIVGQGYHYESPISHLILCEYIASHGYIVVTSPLLGTNIKAVELNMIDFETQVQDLEFLLSKVMHMQNADHEKIAAVGFDLGAMSSTLLQMRNANIKALVCYDGGIIFKHNTTRLLNPSPYYKLEKLNVPALIFTRFVENNFQMGLEEDSAIFRNSPYSQKFVVRTENMKHNYYTSYPSLGIESIASPKLAKDAYPIICEYTLNFLNYSIKKYPNGLKYLSDNPERFISKGVHITVDKIDSIDEPLNAGKLESIILNQGTEKGFEVYRKNKINQNISEDDLNILAYLFLYNYGRANDAISIFKLIIDEYPKSANAFDSLGEAYLFVKDYDLALLNYKKAFELDPENFNAKRIILQLEKLNLN